MSCFKNHVLYSVCLPHCIVCPLGDRSCVLSFWLISLVPYTQWTEIHIVDFFWLEKNLKIGRHQETSRKVKGPLALFLNILNPGFVITWLNLLSSF